MVQHYIDVLAETRIYLKYKAMIISGPLERSFQDDWWDNFMMSVTFSKIIQKTNEMYEFEIISKYEKRQYNPKVDKRHQ